MTTTNKWPKADYRSIVLLSGPVGTNQTKLSLSFPLQLAWDTKTTVQRITCHSLVADSKGTAFEILEVYGPREIERLSLNSWGGCLNVRKM